MKRSTRTVRNDAAMAATILVLGLLLVVTGLILNDRWHSAAARHQAPMLEDLLGVAATASGLAVVAWWIATLLLAIASAVLQQTGKSRSANAAAKLSPAFMRRLAVAVLGLHLVGVPLANASPEPVEPAWNQEGGSTRSSGISAQWAPGATSTTRLSTLTSFDSGPSEIEPQWQPRAPVTEPGLLGSLPQRSAGNPVSPGQGAVVVSRGDSLWSIAARQLGPMASDVDIALHWPKWHSANRHLIGDDPGLLVPGQILQPPPRS
jgi:nucleoid-associated protein YgaU